MQRGSQEMDKYEKKHLKNNNSEKQKNISEQK